MNFSEQLDKFVERKSNQYVKEYAPNGPMGSSCGLDYRSGARDLKPIVLKLYEQMNMANDYLKGFDCARYCDPSVNFHDPLCCIHQDFSKAIREVSKMLEGGSK